MKKEQSSIEWLENKIEGIINAMPEGNRLIAKKSIKKAKELHKKEIIEAANNGCKGMCYIDSPRDGQQYYNEKYQQ